MNLLWSLADKVGARGYGVYLHKLVDLQGVLPTLYNSIILYFLVLQIKLPRSHVLVVKYICKACWTPYSLDLDWLNIYN